MLLTVGAGSAGCVLANRLTENGKFSVLLLEAGGEETKDRNIGIPLGSYMAYENKDNIWDDWTSPQLFCHGFVDRVSKRAIHTD